MPKLSAKSFLAALLALVLMCTAQLTFAQNASTVNVGGTSSTQNITNNVATVVDPALTIASDGNISGFTVMITGSYASGDVLDYTGSLPSGITAASFNTTSRSLQFSGTTSAANWQALLRTVRIRTASAVCFQEQRQVSFIAGLKYYNPLNGHFYEVSSGTSSWENGIANAATQSYFGRLGYMATITSQAENSFVSKILAADSWFGASDNYAYINAAVGNTLYANQSAAEGKWYWVSGPEKGTQMSTANQVNISTVYQNWGGGEPNNYGGSEDYAEIYVASGRWNDLPANYNGFKTIIEYGGMSTDNTTANVVFTTNLMISGAPSGTITGGNVTVCTGSNSTTMTLTGLASGGSVVKWQYSYDDFLTAGVDIPSSASTSYTATNITQNTYYRAVVNTSSCSGLATSSTRINVNAAVPGNIVADNNTICNGASVNFTLNGYSGSIVKWQVSTSSTFASGITDIANTTAALSYQLNTAGTYYFRAVVLSCSNTVYTNIYTINVIAGSAPVGGTVSSATFCGGSNSGTLNLTGSTGNVSKWQYSTDGGIVWTDVANTSTSLSYSGITASRQYRAVLTNGSCGTALSAVGIITVSAPSVAGTITGASSVCAGTNSTTLTLGGSLGAIQWQSSTNNSTFTDIAGETGSTFVATNLSVTTYYRAVVTSGTCAAATSNTFTLTVKQPTSSTTNAAICAGSSYSFAGGSYTTAGTYLVHLTNAAGCDSAATLNLTVNPLPATPSITASGATTFCAGGSVTLTSSGGTAGNAINFSGSQYAEAASTAAINVGTSTDFTYEAWVKLNGNQGNYAGIVVKGNGSAPFQQLVIVNQHIASEIYNGGTMVAAQGTTNLNDGSWHHLAMVVARSTNNCKLYVDGSLEADVTNTAIGSSNLDNSATLLMGVERTKGIYFNGAIDEVRIWNSARTQTEIQNNKSSSIAISTPNLVAYYTFDETSGNTAIDSKGGNNATFVNSPTRIVPTTAPLTNYSGLLWSTGATGGSITVTASGSYTVTASDGTCTATSTPVSVTVNPTNTITLTSAAATATQTVYVNTSLTNITYATANATGASFSGLPSGVTGSWSANVVTISGTPTVSGIYNYTVTLTGGCGTITATGTITVPSVTITSNATSNTICAGTSVTFTATPSYATNPTYQWKKNGVAISGATGSTYTTTTLANNDVITVEMTVSGTTGGTVITSGLIQNLDANKTASYGGTGTTWYDLTGNNNNGTLPSGATFGNTSGYKYFNLSNAYISAPVAKNASMTYNVWAKTSDPSNAMLFNAGNQGSGPDLFFWSNSIYWNIWDSGNSPFGVSTNIIDANWHNYTVVVDATANNAKFYFDGVLKGTATYHISSSSNLYIGGAGPGDTWYWKGAVSSFQTYNRALSAAEVTSNFNALNNASALTSNAITTTVNALPVVSGTTQPGQFGNGLHFDGSNDYVSVPSSSSLNISSAITLEAWVYPTKLSGGIQNVMSKSSSSANNGYIFPRTDNSWSSFVVYLNIGGWRTLSFPYPTTGTWHHLAATYDGSTIKLYLDGTLVNSTAASGSISTNSNILSLGNQPGYSEFYGGNADELRIWNVARTQSQIQATMNTELVGNESGLVAYYNFNQGVAGGNNTTITSVLDKTANANNGSFNTFALNGATSNFVAGATSSNGLALGNVCVGGTIQLSNTTAGGVWSSSNTAAATVNNTGVVTGVASGTSVISYTVTNASGCSTTVTTNITVNDNPVVAAITGNTVLCSNTTTTLSNATTGGVWSSANTSIATVNASGVVSGVSGGTTTINYAVTNASGCTTTVNTGITVNAAPTVATTGGSSAVCVGSTVNYTNATTGGVWSSSNTGIATVDASGVVTGLTAGATTINYTVTNGFGCITTVTKSITVNALPVATISASGSTTLCLGSSVTLTASLGSAYAWSNGATTRSITVNTAGNYNVAVTNANGCTILSANTTVIVNNPSSSTTVIRVPFGGTYLFNGVTYTATGIYVAHLTNAVGCDSTATLDFTVDPKPSAGPDQTVACGSNATTVTLTGTLPTTGAWSSMPGNDPGAVLGTVVNGVVVVTLPAPPFTGKLSYIYTTFGGKDTVDIYVAGPASPVININAGSPILCAGSTVQLCPQTWGFSNYQWYKDGYLLSGSAGTSSCITVDATGIGSYTLAGTNGSGCWSLPSAPQVVSTTNSLTKPTISISGSSVLCGGGNVTLTSSSSTGNLWFKNGNSTGAITQSITVSEPGDYSVLVTTGTCTSAMSLTTTISGGVKAGFTTANASNNCDSTISFTSTSANTTSTWNFGDGTTGTGNSVTHKYATTGLFTVQQAVVSVGGCKDTAVQTITVASCPPPPPPTTCNITPGFTVINNTVNGGSYTYISTSTITNGNMTYFWDLGNGTTSTLISPSVTYAMAGTYQVKLVVTGDLGCKDSITQSVVVTITAPPVTPPTCTAPVADFTINNASQCLTGNIFSFTNTSTGTTPSYTWNFGDGSTAVTTTDASYSYSSANTYTVTLVATNSCGSHQVTKTVTVTTVPATPASISGATSIVAGSTTTLNSATAGGVWSSSNTAVAIIDANTGVVTAVAAGTATISYTVSNSCGTTATSLGITVTAATPPVTPPTCTAPVANFTINNDTQCLSGNAFSFTNTSTGTTPSFIWNFGDGSSAVTTTDATYSYASANTYTVTLVATNSCGSHQVTKTITVATVPAAPSGISGSTTLTVGTTSSYSSATAGGVWSSSNTAVATIDANTGMVTAVAAGSATISYTITNSCGASAATLGITVTAAVTPPVVPPCNLQASFTVNNLSQCVTGNQYIFTNTSTGGTAPFTYLWDLNDGTTATTENVNKTYAVYGDRDVTLKITDANGCTSHANTIQIHVGAQPKAGFSVLTHTGNGQNTTFISSSTIAMGNMTYLWDLGNGQTSTLINPTTTYTPGTYTVKLVVSGIGSCKDSSIQSITELAVASVKVYPNPVMDVIQVSFVSASATPTTFKLMDLAGRTLQIQTVTPSNRGVNVLATMNTRGLQSGSYVLYISDEQNGFLATKAILKQ